MAVYLIQLLCPARHAILALAYEDGPEGMTHAQADAKVGLAWAGLRLQGVDPWCGLCGSRDLKFERGKTRWATMAEAAPHLKEAEDANLATRQGVRSRVN